MYGVNCKIIIVGPFCISLSLLFRSPSVSFLKGFPSQFNVNHSAPQHSVSFLGRLSILFLNVLVHVPPPPNKNKKGEKLKTPTKSHPKSQR